MELSFHHSFSSFNLKLAGGSDEACLFVIFRGLGSGLSLSLSLSIICLTGMGMVGLTEVRVRLILSWRIPDDIVLFYHPHLTPHYNTHFIII